MEWNLLNKYMKLFKMNTIIATSWNYHICIKFYVYRYTVHSVFSTLVNSLHPLSNSYSCNVLNNTLVNCLIILLFKCSIRKTFRYFFTHQYYWIIHLFVIQRVDVKCTKINHNCKKYVLVWYTLQNQAPKFYCVHRWLQR